jgi:thioredoxin 1
MKKVVANRFKHEVIEDKKPVLVEFFTEWSGSAFLIAELLYQLEKQYAEYVKFALVNVDESPEIKEEYGVKKIPTILFFREGEVINQLEGTPSRAKIKDILDHLIEQIENENQ